MDPITFGMVLIGATGGALTVVSIAEKFNIGINEDMIKIVLELVKYGGIFWLMNHIFKIFM